jgi:hypothetical protein
MVPVSLSINSDRISKEPVKAAILINKIINRNPRYFNSLSTQTQLNSLNNGKINRYILF